MLDSVVIDSVVFGERCDRGRGEFVYVEVNLRSRIYFVGVDGVVY